MRAATTTLALTLALSGCVEVHRTIGDQCELNTDCAAPLACRLGRCRNGCAASRDCNLGTNCVVDDEQLGSCLVPDEASCALDSECPAPLVCRMGRCANVCVEDRDCARGAHCEDVEGALTCVDEGENPCVAKIDCEAPRVCGVFERCTFECVEDRDCDEGPCLGNRCAGGEFCRSNNDCDDGELCNGLERCDPLDPEADERGCAPPSAEPCPPGELCDAAAQACGPRCEVNADFDGDGEDATECGGGDCDDSDPEVRPGADELCNSRDDDCDSTSDEGFSLATDPGNCGACGNVCSAAGGTATCVNSSCDTSCASGFADCDGDALNGCEVDLGSDALNCGTCGEVCPLAQACAAQSCGPSPIVAVAAGASHSCALRASGGVVCWGDNTFGQLGDASTTASSAPVAAVGVVDATAIAAGGDTTCAVRAGGRVWCWGDGRIGQLGGGATDSSSTPVRVLGPPDVVALGLGRTHACAQTAAGVVVCWGSNTEGQLGAAIPAGFGESSPSPVRVRGLDGGSLHVGESATCLAGESLRCVGRLGNRSLGPEPAEVEGSAMIGAAASSGSHACGLRDGALVCWGLYGDTLNVPLPEEAPGASGISFAQVATGDSFDLTGAGRLSCARADAGAVHCIGSHTLGQLGDGTPIDGTERVDTDALSQVAGLTDAADLAVGDLHVCAARATGAVVCWGRNHAGQLGNGETTIDDLDDGIYAGEPSPVAVRDLP